MRFEIQKNGLGKYRVLVFEPRPTTPMEEPHLNYLAKYYLFWDAERYKWRLNSLTHTDMFDLEVAQKAIEWYKDDVTWETVDTMEYP